MSQACAPPTANGANAARPVVEESRHPLSQSSSGPTRCSIRLRPHEAHQDAASVRAANGTAARGKEVPQGSQVDGPNLLPPFTKITPPAELAAAHEQNKQEHKQAVAERQKRAAEAQQQAQMGKQRKSPSKQRPAAPAAAAMPDVTEENSCFVTMTAHEVDETLPPQGISLPNIGDTTWEPEASQAASHLPPIRPGMSNDEMVEALSQLPPVQNPPPVPQPAAEALDEGTVRLGAKLLHTLQAEAISHQREAIAAGGAFSPRTGPASIDAADRLPPEMRGVTAAFVASLEVFLAENGLAGETTLAELRRGGGPPAQPDNLPDWAIGSGMGRGADVPNSAPPVSLRPYGAHWLARRELLNGRSA